MLRLLSNEDGASLIEYSILVVLIAVVALLAVQSVGQETSGMFTDIRAGFP
jgi:Flp pilus assembly pilin Flp